MIDIGLDEHIGEGSDGHLNGGRDADEDDFLQNVPVQPQRAQPETDAGFGPQQGQNDQHGGHCLR